MRYFPGLRFFITSVAFPLQFSVRLAVVIVGINHQILSLVFNHIFDCVFVCLFIFFWRSFYGFFRVLLPEVFPVMLASAMRIRPMWYSTNLSALSEFLMTIFSLLNSPVALCAGTRSYPNLSPKAKALYHKGIVPWGTVIIVMCFVLNKFVHTWITHQAWRYLWCIVCIGPTSFRYSLGHCFNIYIFSPIMPPIQTWALFSLVFCSKCDCLL